MIGRDEEIGRIIQILSLEDELRLVMKQPEIDMLKRMDNKKLAMEMLKTATRTSSVFARLAIMREALKELGVS